MNEKIFKKLNKKEHKKNVYNILLNYKKSSVILENYKILKKSNKNFEKKINIKPIIIYKKFIDSILKELSKECKDILFKFFVEKENYEKLFITKSCFYYKLNKAINEFSMYLGDYDVFQSFFKI